jgi:surface protein
MESKPTSTGFFEGTSPKNFSGSFIASASMGLITSSYIASIVVQPGTQSFKFTPAITVTGTTYRLRGTGIYSLAISSGVLSAPVNLTIPDVTGGPYVGDLLTTTNGDWSGSPTSYAYQWKRGATNIGTNANTYTLVNADIGQNITCVVTATNAAGSTPATSNIIVAEALNAPVNTVLPAISGTPTSGNTLTTTDGEWNYPVTSYAYQWKRGATNIGTNSPYYLLENVDRGASITCVVTATNAAGSTPATSNALTIQNLFTTTWTTTTSSETITLPYNGGTYSGTIDWGDGNIDVNDGNVTTHTYATAGTYTVIIEGDCIGWNFYDTPAGKDYITSVVHWGQLQLGTDIGHYLEGCTNLNLSSVDDVIILTGITNMSAMFRSCISLTSVNRINEWATSAVTDMNSMFRLAIVFNQPLSFNTSAVEDMGSMFDSATAFNQNIGTWDVIKVSNFSNFMAGKTPSTFSTTNLNAIYNGWSTQDVQPSLDISFGTARYTAAATAGRLVLTGTKLWTITDGGI